MWISERPGIAAEEANAVPLRRGIAPDQERLRAWVQRLAVPRHIFANARSNERVGRDLSAAFERRGLAVHVQGRHRNVVALPPASNGRALTFVAAHYDSVPDCPGADDNASGLAVMLECARILAGTTPRLPVGFIAFNAEEDGLLGSRDFVARGLPELGCRVRAVHVLEMVGFRPRARTQDLPVPWAPSRMRVPDYVGLIAKERSNPVIDRAMRSLAAPRLRVLGAKTWGPLERVLPDISRSDHFPFWLAGETATLWTDTGNFRNPHYHRATDTPDTLDYVFMRDVTELLTSLVAEEVGEPFAW